MLLPDLLPHLERVIYLDTDTVVLNPLTELWRSNLGEDVLGAVRDAVSPWAAGQFMTHWRDLDLSPETPYFNAGVLVIPLDSWRTHRLAAKLVNILRAKYLVHGDQDALNAGVQGRWLELPRRWNVQTMDWSGQTVGWALMRKEIEEALADPAIIHYTSPGKPWWQGCTHPRSDLWFESLDRKLLAGETLTWQAIPWRVAASRLKHASRVLVKGA